MHDRRNRTARSSQWPKVIAVQLVSRTLGMLFLGCPCLSSAVRRRLKEVPRASGSIGLASQKPQCWPLSCCAFASASPPAGFHVRNIKLFFYQHFEGFLKYSALIPPNLTHFLVEDLA